MSASQHMRRFGQAIGYYPELTKVFGSVTASILFAQLFYWQPKASSELGVYKTAEELERETGLSVDEQRGARKRLVKLGVLVETHKRLEHKIYFRIDEAAFDALWDARFAEIEAAAAPNGETDIPSPERDIPSPGVGNSQSPNGNFPFGKSEIPSRHSNTEDYSRGLQQGITANARAPREPSADAPPFDALAELLALGADPTEAKRWLAYRMERKKPMDAGALDYFLGEVRAAGLTVAQAVHECAGNKWLGFKRGYDGWWNRPQQRTPQRGNTFEHQSSAEQYAQEQAERMRPQIAAMFAAKREKRDD